MRSSVRTYRRDESPWDALRRGMGLLATMARRGRQPDLPANDTAYPGIDANTAIYAIGDIHGRADLLRQAHAEIDADWDAHPAERRLEVYLGDYVDRGPDSAGVISLLRDRAAVTAVMPLMGNHEQILLQFLDGRISDREWLDWGGAATALSYGVNPACEPVLSAALTRAVPREDVHFLRAARLSFRYGPYFFAHAGVAPGRRLENQVADDLLWIRKPFLDHTGSFGAIVVHGHTPKAEPDLKPNRINLDTGAYATHRLSCLRIDIAGAALLAQKSSMEESRAND